MAVLQKQEGELCRGALSSQGLSRSEMLMRDRARLSAAPSVHTLFPCLPDAQVICVSLLGFSGQYRVMEEAPGMTVGAAGSHRPSRTLLSHFISPSTVSGS